MPRSIMNRTSPTKTRLARNNSCGEEKRAAWICAVTYEALRTMDSPKMTLILMDDRRRRGVLPVLGAFCFNKLLKQSFF
jgi:hypothetical protein